MICGPPMEQENSLVRTWDRRIPYLSCVLLANSLGVITLVRDHDTVLSSQYTRSGEEGRLNRISIVLSTPDNTASFFSFFFFHLKSCSPWIGLAEIDVFLLLPGLTTHLL